ncbi:MAG: SPFH domain-containing protein [Acutalibacteraceae bacterium]|nr:SPFH domain-containing protein [Acutalibacteraceae bacterium]
MSIFKRLFSAFTSSVENTVSKPAEPTSNTNNFETNPPAVKNSTYIPDNNGDDMISKYVFNGEIKSGTQIMVKNGEMVVVIKDGTIVDLLQTGVYVIDDSNVSNFATGSVYTISLKESNEIKWGTTNPICFTDKQYGMLSLRARGAYSYEICDIVKFVMDYMNCGCSVNDYTRNLLINAVERVIYSYNGNSYTQLPLANICQLIEEELRTTGINFRVKLDMITPTEESKAAIQQAMQNAIFNNQ